jgi:hypothetical protein
VGQHGRASGSILLGLDGFEVTAAKVVGEEWRLDDCFRIGLRVSCRDK